MKLSGPSYAIVGRGRWAKVIGKVLSDKGRQTVVIEEIRRQPGEDDSVYVHRLTGLMRTTGAEIAWLCLPPSPDIPLIVQAAIHAGLNVVAEKPWLCSHAETTKLIQLAQYKGVLAGVHYQYCFLEGVENWRQRFFNASNVAFGGCFTLNRPDRLGIPAIENLGSHLLAIREFAAPQSQLLKLECTYESTDRRLVWLKTEESEERLDFLVNTQPLIQRFISAFEGKTKFMLDLRFASRVSESVARQRQALPRQNK